MSQIRQKPISIERRLKSWNIEYNFKCNQPYLSRTLNLSCGSNSLNSASANVINPLPVVYTAGTITVFRTRTTVSVYTTTMVLGWSVAFSGFSVLQRILSSTSSIRPNLPDYKYRSVVHTGFTVAMFLNIKRSDRLFKVVELSM